MGADKARIELGGLSLTRRVVAALAPLCDEVLLATAPGRGWQEPGCRLVEDRVPGLGPLGGLASALAELRTSWSFVVACDMPLVRPALLELLWEGIADQVQAVLPRSAAGLQPLCACYAAACLPVLERFLAGGGRRALDFVARLPLRELGPDEWRAADPDGRSFLDADTPEELARMRGALPHARRARK